MLATVLTVALAAVLVLAGCGGTPTPRGRAGTRAGGRARAGEP
jgi:hypothetical protein